MIMPAGDQRPTNSRLMAGNHLPWVMGILNITEDSFSDGGKYLLPEQAIDQAHRLLADGAQIIDIGGESTRPGAGRIDPVLEQQRVLPVIEALAAQGIAVSVDTMNADTARQALDKGAVFINDVSAGKADPDMLRVVADRGCPFIAVHSRGSAAVMDEQAIYARVTSEVVRELQADIARMCAAGLRTEQLILDPGFGFAKLAEHNWELLRGIDLLMNEGWRVLWGVSRKRFLAQTLPQGAEVTERDLPTAVLSVLAAQKGAWGVRVHNAAASAAALKTAECSGMLRSSPESAVTPKLSAAANLSSASSVSAAAAPWQPVISVQDLSVYAHHGVLDFERDYGQEFIIYAQIRLSHLPPDEIEQTLNYAELIDRFAAAATKEPVKLLETLASRLADVALQYPLADDVRITVTKPLPPLKQRGVKVSCTVHKAAADIYESEVYLGLGSNQGDRRGSIEQALDKLAAHPQIRLIKRGPIVETVAVDQGQLDASLPPFLNTAVSIRTNLTLHALMGFLLEVEESLGRRRTGGINRTIDLDILAVAGVECYDQQLILPHPRLAERAFALVPLAAIAPHLLIPGQGSVEQLCAALTSEQLKSVSASVSAHV